MDFNDDFFIHSSSSTPPSSSSNDHYHSHHHHYHNHHDRQALRFRCPIGYRLIGPSLIKCDHKRNEWSEIFPKCQRKFFLLFFFYIRNTSNIVID